MVKEMRGTSHGFGLRAVAVFEGVKGVLILALSFGFLALRHTDVHATVDCIVAKIGINPEAHYPRLLAEHIAGVGDKGLRWFAILALVISLLRFSEAIGLWFEQAWAEWLTLISAGVYLPLEVHHIFVHPGWFGLLILAANSAIVFYLARVLAGQRRLQHAPVVPALVQPLSHQKVLAQGVRTRGV